MKQVDIKTANECVALFSSTMDKLGIDTPAKGLTNSVAFPSKELIEWITSVSPYMTELRVVFGVYNAELSRSKEGRFTVFLWPYNAEGKPSTDDNSNPVLPMNLGHTQP